MTLGKEMTSTERLNLIAIELQTQHALRTRHLRPGGKGWKLALEAIDGYSLSLLAGMIALPNTAPYTAEVREAWVRHPDIYSDKCVLKRLAALVVLGRLSEVCPR